MIIRQATPDDAADMVAVLNPIIAAGGTTAHQRPFDEARMVSHYITPEYLVCCHVAEIDGQVLGFQSLEWPNPSQGDVPKGWAFIASFVANGAAGKGVGQHLFAKTKEAAAAAGVQTIDAKIRADNVPGLKYYSGLGFKDHDRVVDVPLRDGTLVDRIRKRYDLTL